MPDSGVGQPLQHHAVVAADFDDEPVVTARACLNDSFCYVRAVFANQGGTGCAVWVLRVKHLVWWNLVKLLHHRARVTESDRKAEERDFGRVLGSHEGIRDGLAAEIENLAKLAFA
jgi:hypothetical protein